MDRILEGELMDDTRQAHAYARADFSASNQAFVDGLVREFPDHLRTALDIGCGPGDVVIRLARRTPSVRIVAVDGAEPMIALAKAAVRAAGMASRVSLVQARLPALPFAAGAFDAVLSKDLLHHLPDPAVFWREVRRLGRPGAAVYLMDLFRPSTPEAARHIVDCAARDADRVLRQDFFNSLCAAFTVEEVRRQLAGADLDLRVRHVSERHFVVSGLVGV